MYFVLYISLLVVLLSGVVITVIMERKTKQIAKNRTNQLLEEPKENSIPQFSIETVAKATIDSREIVRLKREKEKLKKLAEKKAQEEKFLNYNFSLTVDCLQAIITDASKNHSKSEVDVAECNFFANRHLYDPYYQHLYSDFFNLVMSHFSNMGFEIFFECKKIPGAKQEPREKFIPNLNTNFNLNTNLNKDKFASIKYIFISWEQKVSDLEIKSQEIPTYRGQDIWQSEEITALPKD